MPDQINCRDHAISISALTEHASSLRVSKFHNHLKQQNQNYNVFCTKLLITVAEFFAVYADSCGYRTGTCLLFL